MNEHDEENWLGEEDGWDELAWFDDPAFGHFNPNDLGTISSSQQQNTFNTVVDNRAGFAATAEPAQAYYPYALGYFPIPPGYPVYPPNVLGYSPVLSQAPVPSRSTGSEVLLNDFKSAWMQQNFDIIESKWTDDLKNYISSFDVQACSDLLVFLVTKLTNKANIAHVDKFSECVIRPRKKEFNLENIVDEILKIVFQQIKANHKYSSLVSDLVKMKAGERTSAVLPLEIALPLLGARKLIGQGNFAKMTGLALDYSENRLKIHRPSKNIFNTIINDYLIQASDQNNFEASNATSVGPRAGTSKKRLLDKGSEEPDDDSPSKKAKKNPRNNGDVVDLTSSDSQRTQAAQTLSVYPAIFSPAPTPSEPSIVSQPLEGEALLDDFKSAWIQQDSNIISKKWTDALKNYISSCDIQVCSDLLVFLIDNIKNEDNKIYIDEFRNVICQREERLNLENILDEILKIVFENIKVNHSYLVKKFSDMMTGQRSTMMLPGDIALTFLVTRDLFMRGEFAGITGLKLITMCLDTDANGVQTKNGVQIKAPAPTRLEIFKKTIHKYLIQTSNQNNLEASGATLVEPDEGLEQLSVFKENPTNDEDVFISRSPNDQFELYSDSRMLIAESALTDEKNTVQNLEEQDPVTDEKNTTQNLEKRPQILQQLLSSYTHFFSKKDLGNIGRTCKKFQIACMPRYDYSKVASTKEVFRLIHGGRILCQSLDSSMYAIEESSTKKIAVYGRKGEEIKRIGCFNQTPEDNPVIEYKQIAFSLDSKYLIAYATTLNGVDRIYTWNIETEKLISKTAFPKNKSFSWNFPSYRCLDLKSIIICGHDAKIYKYDFIEGTKTKLLDLRDKESVGKDPFQQFASVVISNNQERILVANYQRNQITIYNLKEGSVIRNYTFNGKDEWSRNYHPFKFISKGKQFIHIEDGCLCVKGIDKTFDFKLAIGLKLRAPDTLSRFSFSLSQNERFLVIPCLKAVVVMDLEVPNDDFLVIECDDTVESAFFNSDNSSLMILANNVLTEYTFNALKFGNYFDSARVRYPGLGR